MTHSEHYLDNDQRGQMIAHQALYEALEISTLVESAVIAAQPAPHLPFQTITAQECLGSVRNVSAGFARHLVRAEEWNFYLVEPETTGMHMTCRKHWHHVTFPHIKWDVEGLLYIKDTNTVASGKRPQDVLPERLQCIAFVGDKIPRK